MQTPVWVLAIAYWLHKSGTVIWICSLATRTLQRISIDDNHGRGY